jgi:hypothetical protein
MEQPNKIDFANDEYRNPYKHKYTIKLIAAIPKGMQEGLTFLFPQNDWPKRQILAASGLTTTISKEINMRLGESKRTGLLMAVAYKSAFYCIEKFTGTMYLAWAERIHHQTINNMVVPSNKENIPILVEMDGNNRYRNVYVIGDDAVLPLVDVMLIEPTDSNLFCCESDPRQEKRLDVRTISTEEADRLTTDPIASAVRELQTTEEPPFFATEELLLVEMGTPRMDAHVGNSNEPDEG